MASDTPDWGGQYISPVLQPLSDMGELAARLDSPVTFDRRGSVVLMRDFEYGLTGIAAGTAGAGSAVALSTEQVYRPPFACKLTSGPSSGRVAQISATLSRPGDGLLGVSCWVYVESSSGCEFDLWISFNSSGRLKKARIILIPGSPYSLEIELDAGQQAIASGNPNAVTGRYLFFKIVANQATLKYERAIVAGTEYDLSAYDLFDDGISFANQFSTTARLKSTSSVARNAWLDTLVMTAYEPANE